MVILVDGAVKSHLLPLYKNVELLFIRDIIKPDIHLGISSRCMLTLILWFIATPAGHVAHSA